MTEKNIFMYKLFLSSNISDFSLFVIQKLNPPSQGPLFRKFGLRLNPHTVVVVVIIIIIIINNFFFVSIIQHLKILQIAFRPKKLVKADYKSSKMKISKRLFSRDLSFMTTGKEKRKKTRA